MRNQLIDLTSEFIDKNAPDKLDPYLDLELFVRWLDCFPFIRMQIKESMMPRVWTLKPNLDEIPKIIVSIFNYHH